MKNILIILLLLMPFLSFGKKIVKFEYVEKDTVTQGDRTYIAISYDPGEFNWRDTIRITLYNFNNSQFTEVLKICVKDADTISPQADYTKWLYYTIPTYTMRTQVTVSYSLGGGVRYLFIRSRIPDITLTSWSSSVDTTQQQFSLIIDYAYQPTNQDSLKILIGDSIVYNGLYQKLLIFAVPDFNYSSTYNLTIIGTNIILPLNITKPTHLVSGLLTPNAPFRSDEIRYYNEQGQEITKPDHGFYIWKTKNSSGKCYLVNN